VPTPYVTPTIIQNAPTGVPWSIIPQQGAAALAQFAEQTNMAWRVTHDMDRICNQPLRATLDTEEEVGPDFRLTVDAHGIGHLIASRWPILSVIGAQVSPAASFPPAWQTLPAGAVRPHTGIIGAYGTTTPGSGAQGPVELDIAPGWVSWYNGRTGTRLAVAYLNGWPHAGLTATANQNATTLQVDDVTGFSGAAPFIYDGANTEQVAVTFVTAANYETVMGQNVPVGPGTLSLAAPLAYTHTVTPGASSVLVTAMPADLQKAGIWIIAADALEAGIEGVVISDLRGAEQSSRGGAASLRVEAEVILHSYRRAL
jgi:hypothetical protein